MKTEKLLTNRVSTFVLKTNELRSLKMKKSNGKQADISGLFGK